MSKQKTIILLVSILLSVGCATPYQPSGFRGGYKEVQIVEGEYDLTFYFNAFFVVFGKSADNYWHQRASELCGGPESYTVIEGPAKDVMPKAKIYGKIRCNS